MGDEDVNKLNRIESLKSKLFSKNFETKIEHRDSYSNYGEKDVADVWPDETMHDPTMSEKFLMKTSQFKKFFVFSIIFFTLTIAYASYMFFVGGNVVSNNNIDINIQGNTFVAGGEELPLVVEIKNRNNTELNLVDLVMEYPKGSQDGAIGETEHFRESLGTIAAGSIRKENLKVTLFGQQGSTKIIKFSLEYRVVGSSAIFVKEKTYEVTISSTPINLTVDAPNSISPNQDIILNIKETLNATKPVQGILLKVVYPVGFKFTSATPAPSYGNNVWNLGDLAPGGEHDVIVSGQMVGVFDGEEKTFSVSTGSQSTQDKSSIDAVFNSVTHTVTVNKPFVDANLFINGSYARQYVTGADAPVSAEIRYANNLSTTVRDLKIEARITGNAFSRTSVQANQGFYDSSRSTITWDSSTLSKLAEVNPGESDAVAFSLSPLAPESSIDPTINIQVNISGKQELDGYTTADLSNSSSAIIKVKSEVNFESKALYYSGPFTNAGSIPPRAEQATTYTVVWTVGNNANALSNVVVSSTLPSWVTYLSKSSPSSEVLSYNSSTRQISWSVGKVAKGTGATGAPRNVSFQISLKPSLSQVGSLPVLINNTVLTGHDDFANVDLKVTKPGLNTQLGEDSSFPANGAVVTK